MRQNLDIDRLKTKSENYIKEELVRNIVGNEPIQLIHDIFYKEDFEVYTNLLNKGGSKLKIGIDYELYEADEVATFDSQRLCYRKILFHENQEQVYIDYWVYGDTLTAHMFENLKNKIDTADASINENANDILALDSRLTSTQTIVDQTVTNVGTLNTRLTSAENNIEDIQEALGGNEEDPGIINRIEDIEETLTGDGETETGLVSRVNDLEKNIEGEGENPGILNRIGNIEESLEGNGESEPGLISRVSDLERNLEGNGEDDSGLVNRIEDIEETIHAPETGIIDNISDINEALVGICYLKEVDNFEHLPPQGKGNTLYITQDDNKLYKWDGESYIELISSGDSLNNGVIPSLYTFEIGDDGYLYIVSLEGSEVPKFEIDDEGYLWGIFEIEEDNDES
jgi:hypothetical protein